MAQVELAVHLLTQHSPEEAGREAVGEATWAAADATEASEEPEAGLGAGFEPNGGQSDASRSAAAERRRYAVGAGPDANGGGGGGGSEAVVVRAVRTGRRVRQEARQHGQQAEQQQQAAREYDECASEAREAAAHGGPTQMQQVQMQVQMQRQQVQMQRQQVQPPQRLALEADASPAEFEQAALAANEELISRNVGAMAEIESEVHGLNQLFAELGAIVVVQGAEVETVATLAHDTARSTNEALRELQRSEREQQQCALQ